MIPLTQLAIAVSAPTLVVLIGLLWNMSAVNRLGDKMDRQGEMLNGKIDRLNENFTNQVTTLLQTIHDVHVRVVRLEERQPEK